MRKVCIRIGLIYTHTYKPYTIYIRILIYVFSPIQAFKRSQWLSRPLLSDTSPTTIKAVKAATATVEATTAQVVDVATEIALNVIKDLEESLTADADTTTSSTHATSSTADSDTSAATMESSTTGGVEGEGLVIPGVPLGIPMGDLHVKRVAILPQVGYFHKYA